MLADSAERMDFLRLTHARGRYLGMETELITPTEAKAMFPLMDETNFVGALWDPVEGHLDPSGTTYAYAKAAQAWARGSILRDPVEELTQQAGRHLARDHRKGHGKGRARGQCRRPVGARGGPHGRHRAAGAGDGAHVSGHRRDAGGRRLQPRLAQGDRRDRFQGEIYTRQERKGMVLGTYEKACVPWSPNNTPWDFGQELLPPDLDRIAPSLEVGFRHFPAFENVGIKQVINGPFTFAPDGNPLVGPVRGTDQLLVRLRRHGRLQPGRRRRPGVVELDGRWRSGLRHLGHGRRALRRLGDLRYTNAKVRENYARRFSIRFPNEELPAARPLQTTPLYDTMMRDQNAVMGDTWGMETPLWFAPDGTEQAHDVVSFHRSNDFAHVGTRSGDARGGGRDRDRQLRQVRGHRQRRGGLPAATDDQHHANARAHRAHADAQPARQDHRRLHDRSGRGERFMMWGSSRADLPHALVRAAPARRTVGAHRAAST